VTRDPRELERIAQARKLQARAQARQAGRLGVVARAAKLSPERRREIARAGGLARAARRFS
jgi:hypothetical protein